MIVSVKADNQKEFEKISSQMKTPILFIGRTIKDSFIVNSEINLKVSDLIDIFYKSIPDKMNAH
ncbi:MAG: hypothetical protein U5K00_19705 [Melioribacteraceae bacterium]|nr:hypothetical protein [Melioribacteraceae bacterium]